MTTQKNSATRSAAFRGCLVGGAVGDALGLPCEGLSPTRQKRLFGTIDGYRLLLGRGLVSDDTEHAAITADALICSAGDPDRFEQELARGLRRWMLTIPAGVGLATLKACLRLLVGVPPARSGVYSAGNGPLMRAAVLGVAWGDDPARLRDLVQRSSRVTHTDPLAERTAWGVANAAHLASYGKLTVAEFARAWEASSDADDRLSVAAALQSVEKREATQDFAGRLGLERGVTGYVAHTFPVALHAALSCPNDFARAVQTVIACGGDTDTTGAIVGGIVGASVRVDQIPATWRATLAEPFLTVRFLEEKATRLAEVRATGVPGRAPAIPYPLLLTRNLGFLVAVLYHGLRRLLPPF